MSHGCAKEFLRTVVSMIRSLREPRVDCTVRDATLPLTQAVSKVLFSHLRVDIQTETDKQRHTDKQKGRHRLRHREKYRERQTKVDKWSDTSHRDRDN